MIIPTWNRSELVCQAIDSALGQTGGDIEVIVIDDGSTDDTAAVLEGRYGSRIKLLKLPYQGGVGAARNVGVHLARGELLAFLDSDDLWLPGKLKAELEVLERFPDAEAIVSDSIAFLNGHRNESSRFEKIGALTATKGSVCRLEESPWLWTACHNGVSTCAITMTRRAVIKLGEPLFAEDLNSCEDWELEVRIYQNCRVIVLPEIWSHIRCIDDNSRIARACPGSPPSREQEICLLRDRLTAMGRAVTMDGLTSAQATEFKRSRAVYVRKLNRLESTVC